MGGVSPQVVLDLFGAFIGRRNPTLRVVHCNGSSHEHVPECGGFCADDEMATRAWSLRALTKPLGVSDAAVLGRLRDAVRRVSPEPLVHRVVSSARLPKSGWLPRLCRAAAER